MSLEDEDLNDVLVSLDNEDDNIINDDDDDDDDMADLFSFAIAPSSDDAAAAAVASKGDSDVDASVMPVPIDDQVDDNASEDSFLQMLEQQKEPITLVDAAQQVSKTPAKASNLDETDLQDMLDWLDQDDAAQEASHREEEEEEMIEFIQPPSAMSEEEVEADSNANEEDEEQEPQFDTLKEALMSPNASLRQIRDLLAKENFEVSTDLRPQLWCRIICGKTIEETLQSSVADSFKEWEEQNQYLWKEEGTENNTNGTEEALPSLTPFQETLREWIMKQSDVLSDRVAKVLKQDKEICRHALASLLLNHFLTGQNPQETGQNGNAKDKGSSEAPTNYDYQDPLLPPVACAILCAGVPKVAASVMLSRIIPTFMPILALTTREREDAAQILHRQFYLLAGYHIPSLVLHLDRHLPNWFLWPNFEGHGPKTGQGFIHQCYLLSHLAGECDSLQINPWWILALWDLLLTTTNNSLRFYLILAMLEAHADHIAQLQGDELKEKLERVLSLQTEDSSGDYSIQDEAEDTTNQDAVQWVKTWTERAQLLWERTPVTVSKRLRRLEDKAVTQALTKRKEEMEARMKTRLEEEAKAHQAAMEEERERRADEARLRLTRARLVAFYRQHNPGKETNINKIMESYKGRYEILDAKLKQKYGVSFNPALKPKVQPQRQQTSVVVSTTQPKEDISSDEVAKLRKQNQIVVRVSPSEVLPEICWSKTANKVRLTKLERGNKLEENIEGRLPLKFYLVDSRPPQIAQDQGRFPTSVSFPPDDFTDPDRLKLQEETFEALRGAIHVVIMGEGFAALPSLYGHKMTQGLAECIAEDDARNNNCAVFFLKMGFPFVSILDGGFAGAHSFLYREGKNHHLRINDVLSDYNPEVSIFGQFERLQNSTGREKAQRAIQNLFDSSLVALTKNARRFESLSTDHSQDGDQQQKKGGGNMVTRFFAGGNNTSGEAKPSTLDNKDHDAQGSALDNESNAGPVFRNPFARKKLSKENSSSSLVVESVEDIDGATELGKDAGQGTNSSKPSNVGTEAKKSTDQNKAMESSNRPEPPKANPFAGFGAAFKKATAGGDTAGNKGRGMNPFARFNPGVKLDRSQHGLGSSQHSIDKAHQALGNSKHGPPGNAFAGLNKFRKNAFALMRNNSDLPADNTVLTESEDLQSNAVVFDQTSVPPTVHEPEQMSAVALAESSPSADIGNEEQTKSETKDISSQ